MDGLAFSQTVTIDQPEHKVIGILYRATFLEREVTERQDGMVSNRAQTVCRSFNATITAAQLICCLDILGLRRNFRTATLCNDAVFLPLKVIVNR